MNAPTLPEKVLAVDRALVDVPHAFGGALALAYYAEPRTTLDIDVNVFVSVDEAGVVLDPLESIGVTVASARPTIERDGQTRLWWGQTPLDMFFSYDPFHEAAAAVVRTVPFGDAEIPILSPDHLAVCKVVFDRPKDWVDIEAMLEFGTPLHAAEIVRWVGRLVGDTDRRYERITALLTA